VKRKLVALAAIVAAPIFFEACAPSQGENNYEILPAERLVKKLEANRRRVKTFVGKGTLLIETEDFRNEAFFRVALKKPDSLNLNVLGPFGIELANALATEEDFKFYDAMNNILYQGAINEEILETIFRVDLTFQELIDAFVGSVNMTDLLYTEPDEYKVDYEEYVLTFVDDKTRVARVFRVSIRDLGVTHYQVLDENGNILVNAVYEDFEKIEGATIPTRARIVNHAADQSIEIVYDEIRVNDDDVTLYFEPPNDATIVVWE
jgi:outer membrane lipoprotein-sorting protein